MPLTPRLRGRRLPPPGAFLEWLNKQRGRNDPIEDIAYTLGADGCAPTDGTIEGLLAHRRAYHRTSWLELAALAEAWGEWVRTWAPHDPRRRRVFYAADGSRHVFDHWP